MSEQTNTVKIPLFNGTGFSNWRFRIQSVMDEKNLTAFLTTKLDKLLEKAKDDKEKEELKKKEKQCKNIIVQSIHDDQLENVKDKKTAKEMIDCLAGIFERKSIAGQLLLRRQLLTMKYSESDEMSEHLLKFDKMIRELKSSGANMEDLDIVCHLLLTLPKTYGFLVTAIETMDQSKITLDFVKSRLLDEFNKKKTGVSSERATSSAMNAGITCYGCGQVGHIKSQCKSKQKDKKNFKKKKNSEKNSANATQSNDSVASMSAICEHTASTETVMHTTGKNVNKACNSTATAAAATTTTKQHSTPQIKFFLDSGATEHMVNKETYFKRLHEIDDVNISVAKRDASICAKQKGDIFVKTFHNGDDQTKAIRDVLFVKDLKCNLMSIRSLTKRGYRVVFEGDTAEVSFNGDQTFIARVRGKLYEVDFNLVQGEFAGLSGEQNSMQNSWHFRLGHLNVNDMKKLVDRKMAHGLDKLKVDTHNKFCESCILGKQARLPFPPKNEARSNRILQLIHTDVCDYSRVPAHDGTKYFVTFTDDYSRASMVYCIKLKSDVFEKFKEFVAMSEARHGTKIAKLKADNGGEYISNEFKGFCREKGIELDYTVPHNPEMNSVAERLNRTLVEKARTMLTASGLDQKFWSEAVLAANYVKNRCPTSAFGKQFMDKTPAEIWFGVKPNLSNLRIFGSICFNHIPAAKRSKFDVKSTKCFMLSYASNGSYRLWDIQANKMIVGRNVIFNENSVLNRCNIVEICDSEADGHENSSDAENDSGNVQTTPSQRQSSQSHDVNVDNIGDIEDNFHGADTESIGNNEDIINGVNVDDIGNNLPRRSERERRAPERYGDWATEAHFALSAQAFVEDDPISIAQAKQRSDWKQWEKAINEEHSSLMKNDTWTVCHLPKGRKAISSKWVFKLKRTSNGDIDKYKARVVARGFSQLAGFDYNETYAPVAKLTTLRILLSIAAQLNLKVHQMDVKGAFLNGDLSEEIYMNLPEGFEQGDLVCKLNKSLYGLKQASRNWNDKFNRFMLKLGFKRCDKDRCLYVKEENGIKCYVLLYVDDLLIVCANLQMIQIIKNLLHKEFEMTDIGKVNTYLGVHIEQDEQNGTITLSQTRYLQNVLKKFGMNDSKVATTPMEKGLNLAKGDPKNLPNVPYRELIGCLTYATITTRPDICAATNYFSRFQSCYTLEHFTHAKRILRYIKGTLSIKMAYRHNDKADLLVGFVDADYGNDINDRKSISGFVFKVYGNTIAWASRKQESVSLSSTEAEYVSLALGISEEESLTMLLNEIGFKQNKPIVMFEDNQSCQKVAEGQREYKRMKHIDVKFHFIQDLIAKGKVQIEFKPSTDQLADIMTKAIGRILFEKHRKNLNLI